MEGLPPNLTAFFVGRLAGHARVTGLTGRLVRTFRVEFFGEWSIGEDALYLDQSAHFDNGKTVHRHWAVQFEGDRLAGHDSKGEGRVQGRIVSNRVRLIFYRPIGVAAEVAPNRLVLEFREDNDGYLIMDGRAVFLGLTVRRTLGRLSRE
ncbi:MAG: DUF3833 family protein [Caulobacteraceae bacterium]|nr:DUF3833 family protein [Caulobacteraceae bacterium]